MCHREDGARRGGRGIAFAFLPFLAVTLSLFFTSPAQAQNRWSDISDAQWLQGYGVTAAQVATVAQGYLDGAFGPAQTVARAQFIKMVMSAFELPPSSAATPPFCDLLPGSFYISWIEGAVQSGLIQTAPGQSFRPTEPTTRQEASQPLAAYLVQKARGVQGGISGRLGIYPSLDACWAAEGPGLLAGFDDAAQLSPACAPSEAYLVFLGIVQGSGDDALMVLDPTTSLTRAQAVALILRAKARVPVAAPAHVEAIAPTDGPPSGGTSLVITGGGFAQATSVCVGDTQLLPRQFRVLSDMEIDVPSLPPGTGSVDISVVGRWGTSESNGGDVYTYTATPSQGNAVVQTALGHLGAPYVWGDAGPSSFDCSGLVQSVFAELGIALPHHAASQYPLGSPVDSPQLEPGDLVFFGDPIYHVGIYLGDGNMVDAPQSGSYVRLEPIDWDGYSGACRVFPQDASTCPAGSDPLHEQTEAVLAYSGAWSTVWTASASGGSFAFADSLGASMTVRFTGTQLTWIAKRSPRYGRAAVTLDGGTPSTVDLYSSSVLWQQRVWSTGLLASGPHTVHIQWTGTQCPASSGTNINVDALEVTGALD